MRLASARAAFLILLSSAAVLCACAPGPAAQRHPLSGQDGNKTVSGTETVNLYAPLASAAAPGATKLVVTNASGFAAGDLVLVVAAQGAAIETTDGATYGQVSGLGSAGLHEWWLLSAVNTGSNELTLDPGCGLTGLQNDYPLISRPQVIRVPQYASLTVPAGATLTGKAWDGSSGGFVVVHVEGAATVEGTIDADGLGLRAGSVAANTGTIADTPIKYVDTMATGGEKGEGIAGSASDYDLLGGRYGRGAPANGGGGGNGYLAGGGGGAGVDAASAQAYSGQGTMLPGVTGGAAWTLDPGNASSGGPGGGRGGYSLSAFEQDALTTAPGSALWGGNARAERGGLGGHAPVGANRLFLGGGGGAGHFDGMSPPAQGNAGRGGGVIYLSASSLQGAGAIHADGRAGLAGQLVGTNSLATVATGGGAGGGGGGGMVLLRAPGSASITVAARGGAGGALSLTGSFALTVSAASGPGGGGAGGGVVLGAGLNLGTPPSVAGGLGGTSSAAAVAEFPSNGASAGDAGTSTSGLAAATAPVACLPADVQITLGDSADPIDTGSSFSLTATVLNKGPNAANDLVVTLTLAAGATPGTITAAGWSCGLVGQVLTCTRALLLANASSTITLAATAPASPAALSSSASVSSREDPAAGNNTDGETTTVQLPQADLALDKTAPAATASAEAFVYTLAVTNNGPRDAPSFQIVDTLPAGMAFVSASGGGYSCTAGGGGVTCTHGALVNGASASVDLTVTAPALSSASDVVNSASVSLTSATTADPTASNNTDSATTSVRPVDLSITKVDLVDPVVTSGALSYTLTVTNPATVAAHGVVVSDMLPAGTSFVSAMGTGWTCGLNGATIQCTRPKIDPSPAVTPTISVVLAAPATAGTVSNTATVTATATDPALGNNTATQQTTIIPPDPGSADVSVSLVDTVDPVPLGMPIDYTISVSNAGPDPAAGVQVVGTVPADCTFVSATGTGWSCTHAGSTLTCVPAAPLPVGNAPAIALRLSSPSAATQLSVSFIVAATTPDPSLANNSDAEATTVVDTVSINDPPVLTMPGSLSTLEDTSLVLDSPAPSIADPDAGEAEVELRIETTACVFTLSGTLGLTFLDGDGVLDPVLRARGTIAELNAALDGSIVTPEPNFYGSATLSFEVDDLGNTGTGGNQKAARSVVVAVIAVDDPPTATDDVAHLTNDTTALIDALANDRSGEVEQGVTLVSVDPPTHGATAIVDGRISYTPVRGYLGEDQFEYTITDGTTQASATVHVTVDEPTSGPGVTSLGGGGVGCSAAPGAPSGMSVVLLLAIAACLLAFARFDFFVRWARRERLRACAPCSASFSSSRRQLARSSTPTSPPSRTTAPRPAPTPPTRS